MHDNFFMKFVKSFPLEKPMEIYCLSVTVCKLNMYHTFWFGISIRISISRFLVLYFVKKCGIGPLLILLPFYSLSNINLIRGHHITAQWILNYEFFRKCLMYDTSQPWYKPQLIQYVCYMHTKKKFLHTNAYFAFLICRLVYRLHEHMAVLLADPTKITHGFTHNNIW